MAKRLLEINCGDYGSFTSFVSVAEVENIRYSLTVLYNTVELLRGIAKEYDAFVNQASVMTVVRESGWYRQIKLPDWWNELSDGDRAALLYLDDYYPYVKDNPVPDIHSVLVYDVIGQETIKD